MKIAVVGCGAVGSFYGAKLARAGHETHFLLRSDYEFVRRNGVSIRSAQGNFNVRPRCARDPEEIGPVDLILIGLKATANDLFKKLIPPLVAPQTAILTLQNGLGNEDQLAAIFPVEQILGGLCFVCLNRLEPGLIRHIAHGMIVMGEFKRWPEPRTHDLAAAFKAAGVPCKVAANLERAHWEKLVWNIPFNGLGVAGVAGYEALTTGIVSSEVQKKLQPGQLETLTTADLLAKSKWEALVRELMLEVIRAARAQKLRIPDSLAEKQIERTRSMGPYKASTLLDFERGLPLELQSLFLEPLKRARSAGVQTPILESLSRILTTLNALRGQIASF